MRHLWTALLAFAAAALSGCGSEAQQVDWKLVAGGEADSRTVRIGWTDTCGDRDEDVRVDERGETVDIEVERGVRANGSCSRELRLECRTITLDEPLGERELPGGGYSGREDYESSIMARCAEGSDTNTKTKFLAYTVSRNTCVGSLCVVYNRHTPRICAWAGNTEATPNCPDVTAGGADCDVNTEDYSPPPRTSTELRQALSTCGFDVDMARQRVCDDALCLIYSVGKPESCQWDGEDGVMPPCAAVTVGAGDCNATTTDHMPPPSSRQQLRDALGRCEARFGIPFVDDRER